MCVCVHVFVSVCGMSLWLVFACFCFELLYIVTHCPAPHRPNFPFILTPPRPKPKVWTPSYCLNLPIMRPHGCTDNCKHHSTNVHPCVHLPVHMYKLMPRWQLWYTAYKIIQVWACWGVCVCARARIQSLQASRVFGRVLRCVVK